MKITPIQVTIADLTKKITKTMEMVVYSAMMTALQSNRRER